MKPKAPLIDTDIIIDITKGKNPNVLKKAQAYIAQYSRYAISQITVAELAHGFYKREGTMQSLRKLLKQCRVIRLNRKSAILAGEIAARLESAGQRIGFADTLIAAIAIENGSVIITANMKHFQRVAALGYSLTVENWRQ